MCGIAGIVSFAISPRQEVLEAMTQALSHRGPDDAGHWVEGPVGLGHRRLSIIDLSSAGHQPMLSADKRYVLTFNGEIYNYREIRAELSGYPFTSQTDSEVLLAAYQQWGASCLERINGMFAFAIWDRGARELIIARDRLGIKPLYYTHYDSGLLFSSEIRSLLASGLVEGRLDSESLVDYLRYQTVQTPRTILQKVSMLPPGHFLKVTENDTSLHAYWSPLPENGHTGQHDREEWLGLVEQKLRQAVERRLVADVPFGAFLSGGIDSSAIVALMSEVSAHPVSTFSVTFAEEEFSEARYARMVSKKFGTQHHEIQLSPDDFLEALPDALAAMDHPSGDGPNTYVVSRATKRAGITMALSGLGGDELFAGYPVFRQSMQLQRMQMLNKLPRALRRLSGQTLATLRPSVAMKKVAGVLAQERIDPINAYPLVRQVLLDQQLARLLPTTQLPANSSMEYLRGIRRKWPLFDQSPLLSQVSIAEIGTYMQNVLLRDTDQMSMAHALEVRVPFLDHELVELALRIPDTIKYPHTPKQLLVEALGDRLPPEIVHRPKMGFTLPYAEWMTGPLRTFCSDRLEQLAASPRFDAPSVRALWQDFMAGKPTVSWSRIWALVVLSDWMKRHEIRIDA